MPGMQKGAESFYRPKKKTGEMQILRCDDTGAIKWLISDILETDKNLCFTGIRLPYGMRSNGF